MLSLLTGIHIHLIKGFHTGRKFVINDGLYTQKWSYRNSNKGAKSSAQSTGKALIKFAAQDFFN